MRQRPPPVPFLVVAGVVALVAVAASAVVVLTDEPDRGRGGAAAAAGTAAAASPSRDALSADPEACAFGREPALDASYAQWARTLVDTDHALPAAYSPPDLVSVAEAGFGGAFQVRSGLIPALTALGRAAAAAGHPLAIAAAFRSFADQQALLRARIAQLGRRDTLTRVSIPGHSEHQLGTTVDFESAGTSDVTQAWGASPAGTWLAANAYRFGFVMSYPRGDSSRTCYAYEPWHFRYVGLEEARAVRGSGEPLRVYLWKLDGAA